MLINTGRKYVLFFIFALVLAVGCDSSSDSNGGGGGGGGGGNNDALIQRIIDDYVDNVVICTYELLYERAITLREAVEALEANPTGSTLQAARDAWISARIPWEQSEAWLFGPVDAKGHDPALDSWPVNRTDLDNVLDSANDLTPAFIRNLDPSLKGFHTAEYLLFAFEADELGDREFEYLVSVVGDIELTAEELLTDWSEGDGNRFPEPFGDVMKDAGDNQTFPSLVSALQQIIEGMSIIVDEVAAGKIADPFDNKDVEAVESQFSFNSRADFANDITGVLNAYLGNQPDLGKFGDGIIDLLEIEDAALAARVEDEINDAINKILAIPQPFRDAILDPEAADEIVAAQDALRALFATLNGPVLDIINDQ